MTSKPRVICVTGATSGIGKATAELFIKEGWRVIAVGRRRERLAELALGAGERCLPLPLDVCDKKAVAEAFAGLPEAFRPVDVLVNNAGGALGVAPAQEALLEDWEGMVDVNIKGLLYCTKAVIDGMAARGSGHIVNIGSIASFTAYPGANTYGGTKAFVAQFSRNLRADLHGTGVRVTNIEPGLLESEFSLVRLKGDKARADAVYYGAEPLKPEDVADVVHFAVTRPAHVDISRLQIMPVCQSDTGTRAFKKS